MIDVTVNDTKAVLGSFSGCPPKIKLRNSTFVMDRLVQDGEEIGGRFCRVFDPGIFCRGARYSIREIDYTLSGRTVVFDSNGVVFTNDKDLIVEDKTEIQPESQITILVGSGFAQAILRLVAIDQRDIHVREDSILNDALTFEKIRMASESNGSGEDVKGVRIFYDLGRG